jgi:hypothetical protein
MEAEEEKKRAAIEQWRHRNITVRRGIFGCSGENWHGCY